MKSFEHIEFNKYRYKDANEAKKIKNVVRNINVLR